MTEVTRAMEIVKREYELPNNFLELWQSDSERRGIFSTLTFELSKNGDNRTAEQFIFDSIGNLKKVVIPKFVAEWLAINKLSSDLIQLYEEVEYATDSDGFIEGKWDYSGEFYDWIVGDTDNIYKLSDALRYGYEIEKEKLYRVELPELGYLIKRSHAYYIFVNNEKLDNKRLTSKLTEQEIKSIDERYWAFAEEVEG